jgi:hypothetical protein
MSKSKKKQVARERAQQAEGEGAIPRSFAPPAGAAPVRPPKQAPAPAPEVRMPASPRAASGTPVDEALFERVAEVAELVGQPLDEGERQAWAYNGDTFSIKYVEEGEDPEAQPRRLMVAAFRLGVVYQVEGDRQVVYQPGDWEARAQALLDADATTPETP